MRAGWILGAAALIPCVAGTGAIWLLPEGRAQAITVWPLCLYVMAIVVSMGVLHLYAGWKQRQAPGALALTAAPAILALLACALIPLAGFRWSIALLMGALAGQSLLDLNGDALPGVLQRIRPPVAAGVLVCLLIAFMAC